MSTLTARLQHKVKKSSKKPLRWLRKAALAEWPIYHGPFGERDILPCDYYATGGTLKIIEKYVAAMIDPTLERQEDDSVLPRKKLVDMREEARRFIHKATNCSENHVVIFTEGNSFVDVFLSYINALDIPRLCSQSRRSPVILIGHDLWGPLRLEVRKFGAESSEIQVDAEGRYDTKKIDALLKFFKKQERLLVGVFSVGNAITGVQNDMQRITAILHSYGALAIWDYSSAGAYTKIDMCPLVSYGGLTFKDAAFIKTDQFLGGNEASGIFITTANVLRNPMFETGYEGIMAFSCIDGALDTSLSPHSTNDHMSTHALTRKLVAGPIRAHAAFELKGYFGDCYLQNRTLEISERLKRALNNHENVHIIGGQAEGSALPYLSLFFFHPHTEWALHHGFVVALLQDLFGIAALPFSVGIEHLPERPTLESQRFMHNVLSNEQDVQFVSEKIMHVGCVHFSLMYFMRDVDLDYLVSAIKTVAEEGWRLLPFYRFNVATGKWIMPHSLMNKTERLTNTMAKLRAIQSTTQSDRYRHVAYLERANKIIHSIKEKTVRKTLKQGNAPQGDEGLSPVAQSTRWFMTPSEAAELLEDASPVRISNTTMTDRANPKRRTWPGAMTSPAVSTQMSFRAHQQTYKRRFGH